MTIYPGAHHKEHSRPIHRIDHKTSNNDSVVHIGMQLTLYISHKLAVLHYNIQTESLVLYICNS